MSIHSPTDETILSLSREGRNDAEIAVRLGLTVGDVRERRERLGASAPISAPGQPPIASRRRVPRWLLAAGAVFVIGWLAFGLYLQFSGGNTTKEPEAAQIDLGRVVLTLNGVSVQADERPALTVLTVPSGTVIRSADKAAWVQQNQAPHALLLSHEGEGEPLLVLFGKMNDATLFEVDWSGGVRVVAPGGESSAVVFVISRTMAGEIRTVSVDEAGMVSVKQAALSRGLALNSLTGEALDLKKAIQLGTLAGTSSTRCGYAGSPRNCVVNWLAEDGAAVSPFEGELSCGSDGSWRLRNRANGYTLLFDWVGPGCSNMLAATKLPLTVSTGEKLAIPDGVFDITAIDREGLPVSLAAAGDGTLYAGKIVPTVACPCIGPR